MKLVEKLTHLFNRVPTPSSVPTAPNAYAAQVPVRNIFRQYLTGSGIEVGALHNPLSLAGLNITEIKYVDRMTNDNLIKQYPELGDAPLTPVDILDNGELLTKIADHSLDFIIANHFIEHTRNPIGTISNWLTKLKSGGIIFMAVPDKRYSSDVDRYLTPLQHLIEDSQIDEPTRLKRDRDHFVEWVRDFLKFAEAEIEPAVTHLMQMDYSIHFHTFVMQSFLHMLTYMQQEQKASFTIKASADTLQGSHEFLFVLERT